MTDREQLTELISKSFSEESEKKDFVTEEYTADYLLANGVIVPPCKVGDMVWYELYGKIESAVVYSCVGAFKKYGVEITDANAKSSDGLEVTFNGKCIGKTVFLTKEEAEQKLKELKDNGNKL